MNLYTLLSAIRDGVAHDTALAAWATIGFGRNLTVFAGIPSSDFPNLDNDAPFLVLGDPADSRGRNSRVITYEISGWVGLTNSDRTVDAHENIKEPVGVRQIIEGLALVRSAIAAALPDAVVMERFETAADTLGAHDEIHGHFETILTEELVIGQDPLD